MNNENISINATTAPNDHDDDDEYDLNDNKKNLRTSET